METIAKAKDHSGIFAKIGMKKVLADKWNVHIYSDCVEYTVDTFLKCVDSMSFTDYMKTVQVYRREDFIDLVEFGSLDNIVDALMYIYDIEAFYDITNDLVYTTKKEYTDKMNSRKKLNYIGIIIETEKLAVLYENNIVTQKDIDVYIEILDSYGFDIEETYDCRELTVRDTADTILDRMNQIFELW